jgi:hypothetical protein
MKLTDTDRKRAAVDMMLNDLSWTETYHGVRRRQWTRSDRRYRITRKDGHFMLYRLVGPFSKTFVGMSYDLEDMQALSVVVEERHNAALANALLEQLAKDGAIG